MFDGDRTGEGELDDREMMRGGRRRVPGLWHNRNFMLVWSGQTVSALGSSVSGIGFPLITLALTNSPAQAGVVGALRALPSVLLNLPAGALVDRWNIKSVMMLCDAGRALALGSIPVALEQGHLSVAQLYIAATAEGILFVFYNNASFAALPHLVSAEQLPAAFAQNEASYYAAAGLVGSTVGGALYQVGRAVPFALDALSYVASVLSLLLLRTRMQRTSTQRSHHLGADIAAGLRWMWNQPFIRAMSALYGAVSLVSPGSGLILIVIAKQQHASPAAIGAIFSIGAVGGIAGSALGGRVQQWMSFGQTIISVRWIVALLWALYAAAPNAVILGIITAGVYFLNPIVNVVGMSYSVRLIPEGLRGRVSSIFQLIPSAVTPIGLGLTGLLLQIFGPTTLVLTESLYLLVLAVGTTLNTHIRHAPALDHL